MASNALAKGARFDAENLWLELADGRQLGAPLACFPRLLNATAQERETFVIAGGGSGIHWNELDEDISVDGLLMAVAGRSRR